jgi:N-acetyl-1-D-myo-inositol-2-amino-2-deoxy-alpha-D-glucopyranoside deacetylase
LRHSLSNVNTSEADSPRRLLLVHAHPDDETIGTGATMAKYAAEGAHVTLITCTLGEEGEILVPDLEHLAANRDGGLGEYRIGELTAAMSALGISDHRWLGGAGRWRDSGMMGEPSNDNPECFWQADLDAAIGELVKVVREIRPQVMISYDDNGGYGHPDHIQAHRVAIGAFEAAGDEGRYPDTGPAWAPSKFYEAVIPTSMLQRAFEALKVMGEDAPFGVASPEELPFGVPDDQVTTQVDARTFLPAKVDAMRAYPTQIAVDGHFFALSNEVGQGAFGLEHYRLSRGQSGAPGGQEDDLFAGVA